MQAKLQIQYCEAFKHTNYKIGWNDNIYDQAYENLDSDSFSVTWQLQKSPNSG